MVDASIGGHEHAPSKGWEFKWGRAGLAVAVAGALFGTYEMGRNYSQNSPAGSLAEATAPVTPVRERETITPVSETETAQAPALNYTADRMERAEAGFAEYARLARKYHSSPSIVASFAIECRTLGDRRPLEECIVERMQAR